MMGMPRNLRSHGFESQVLHTVLVVVSLISCYLIPAAYSRMLNETKIIERVSIKFNNQVIDFFNNKKFFGCREGMFTLTSWETVLQLT